MSQIGGVQSANKIRADYLLLLTTQLSNQNPLDPMDNKDMASQLAQLSQLEQIEGLSRTFDEVLANQKQGSAAALIGKQITFFPQGAIDPVIARVDSVDLSGDEVQLRAGQWVVAPSDVQVISN